jgi:hypothetical protein
LVGDDGVTYGHVNLDQIVGPVGYGNVYLHGYFTSGTLRIEVWGTINYALIGLPSNFSFEGYDHVHSGLAVNFRGTVSQNYQHATVSGSLAVYYPDPRGCQPGDKVHYYGDMNQSTYYERPDTPYTHVSGNWF